jgi:hypothetical protein
MMSGLSQQYTSFTSQAAQFGSQAKLYGQVADLSFAVAGNAGTIANFFPQGDTPSKKGSTPYPQGQQI